MHFLTRGPSVDGNFDLGTPNSVRGYTLARPTWHRMKNGAGAEENLFDMGSSG